MKFYQVQVEVEEQEIDGDGNVCNTIQKQRKQITATEYNNAPPVAYIRESSRDRLNRLNELYANPQNLSSPVHRTESGFTIDEGNETRSGIQPKPRSTKLDQLIKSRSEWEDEAKARNSQQTRQNQIIDQIDAREASPQKSSNTKVVGVINKANVYSPQKSTGKNTMTKPIANRMTPNKKSQEINDEKNSCKKQLNLEKSYIDSLEMQGYRRRDTTTKRLEYDFNDTRENRIGKANIPSETKAEKNDKKNEANAAKKVDFTKGKCNIHRSFIENLQTIPFNYFSEIRFGIWSCSNFRNKSIYTIYNTRKRNDFIEIKSKRSS